VGDLWATKSEDDELIVHAISFQDFQLMWSWFTNVTGRRTDDMRSQDWALHCSASCGKNCIAKLHQIFRACCLRPWLSPSLTALRHVMYFQFYGWRHVFILRGQWARNKHAMFKRNSPGGGTCQTTMIGLLSLKRSRFDWVTVMLLGRWWVEKTLSSTWQLTTMTFHRRTPKPAATLTVRIYK